MKYEEDIFRVGVCVFIYPEHYCIISMVYIYIYIYIISFRDLLYCTVRSLGT